MTLCMVAECYEDESETHHIVAWADTRVETDWAGADTAFKLTFTVNGRWPALMAGDLSKARDLGSTLCRILDGTTFDYDNVTLKINEASAAHKAVLCERLVRARLGISFERFLTQGERELTPEVRNRVLYEIEQLTFGCSLISFGFIRKVPQIFCIDSSGEVIERNGFAAIGTGSVVAESVLFHRQQDSFDSLDRTLYNLFEASRMACEAKAPGVGQIQTVFIYSPDDKTIRVREMKVSALPLLKKAFDKYGPKPLDSVPSFREHLSKYMLLRLGDPTALDDFTPQGKGDES